MRIVFITSSDTPSGGARQAMYLAHGLATRGHSVTFFTPEKSPLPNLCPEAEDLTWRTLPERTKGWRKTWQATIETVLDPAGPDATPTVVHAFHNKAVKMLSWWGIGWKARNVVCVGHRGVVFRPGNPLPYVSPGMDAFVVNSQACAKVLKPYCLGSKRIHVVYNAIPEERCQPAYDATTVREELNIPQDAKVLGCVMNDNPNKGLDIVIKALQQMQADSAGQKPYFVAVGINYPSWMEKAKEHGVDHLLRCVPSTENVATYLNAMDGFVLPSRSESKPNTLMEAIRMGLPCIGTNVGGVPELLQGVGKLLPSEDVDAMAKGMYELAFDEELRTQWADASKAASPRYSIEERSKKIEALYRHLLAERGYSPR